MTHRMLAGLLVALAATPMMSQAQGNSGAVRDGSRQEQMQERREQMRARRDAMQAERQAMTPEQREAARARREARFNALPPEQQQYARDMRAYTQGLREKSRELRGQVSAGSLTREQMAEQLRAYRDANKPARPAGLRERRPTP
jgi:hypothetical protein